MHHVHMGESNARVVFGIAKNVTVPDLLGTLFFDKFVKGIFPDKRKIVSYNSKQVSISMVTKELNYNATTTTATDVGNGSVLAVEAEEKEYVVHVVIFTTLRPTSELPFLVTTNESGIVQVDSHTPFGQ